MVVVVCSCGGVWLWRYVLMVVCGCSGVWLWWCGCVGVWLWWCVVMVECDCDDMIVVVVHLMVVVGLSEATVPQIRHLTDVARIGTRI